MMTTSDCPSRRRPNRHSPTLSRAAKAAPCPAQDGLSEELPTLVAAPLRPSRVA